MIESSIGARIKARREACGLSVLDLAKRLGKTRSTIYRYENDEIRNLPTTILVPLAKTLHTTPTYLLGWAPAHPTESYHLDHD